MQHEVKVVLLKILVYLIDHFVEIHFDNPFFLSLY